MLLLIFLLILSTTSGEFTDEMQVYEQECLGADKFQCLDGACIAMMNYCDGRLDCPDGSDENFCPIRHVDSHLCNVTHQYLCADHQKCIPATWVCNAQPECDDGSDELNCTSLPVATNATCKGFLCGDGKCISPLWLCDGAYDCNDRSDEDVDTSCRHALLPHEINDGLYCNEFPAHGERNFRCLDSSFCLPLRMMCNGLADCKDESDEASFCYGWHTQCKNFTCHGNATCVPDRTGPACLCNNSQTEHALQRYNPSTQQCENINDCAQARPKCSQFCEDNYLGHICKCDSGWMEFGTLCYAPGPEPMMFYSTQNEIRYIKLKSKHNATVVTGLKQAHGVTYDGKHLYWVESARGHQSIMRAELDNVNATKQVVVSLGIEDVSDVAVDWLGDNIYFSDSERGVISVCRADGALCAALNTSATHPKFITLDVPNGKMYWADWYNRPVIMSAKMDGSHSLVMEHELQSFATGLAIDSLNRRLYYVDKTIRVVKLDDGQVYSLFEESSHHPYAVSVFENTVYWSEWTTNSIQAMDKMAGQSNRNVYEHLNTPAFGLFIYHPVEKNYAANPCERHNCSHLCLLASNSSRACACPEGMRLDGEVTCQPIPAYSPQNLVIGAGSTFTQLQYNALGNPELNATFFNIGRVQAMAYDSERRRLFLFDGQRKTIDYIQMSDFGHGVTTMMQYLGLEDVVDMDYDYVTDTLYFLDAGRLFIEVLSLKTEKRAIVYRFRDGEVPISFCVMPDYGRMLVAVMETEQNNEIHIDSIGLNGEGREHLIMNNLKGPHVLLRYSHAMDNVYIADEGNGVIDFMHPRGTGRETFRVVHTSVTSMVVTDLYIFWTDSHTPRLFWADIHQAGSNVRQIKFSIFPNNTRLHIQGTPPLPRTIFSHPCLGLPTCSDVCVQKPHQSQLENPYFSVSYSCLCTPGLLLIDGQCTKLARCKNHEMYCHMSNECVLMNYRCDGKKDCRHGEDEENCAVTTTVLPSIVSQEPCPYNQMLCGSICKPSCDDYSKLTTTTTPKPIQCEANEFRCGNDDLCIQRLQICDGTADCPDESDEEPKLCDTLSCLETEFMCTSGSCILSSWRCDGDPDCTDGSDEVNCVNRTCKQGFYQCHNGECVELLKRCDGQQDCVDFSDEDDCEEPTIADTKDFEPSCAEGEFACETNRTICLPSSARCDGKNDCPDSADEKECTSSCSPLGMFTCTQDSLCIQMKKVCNGLRECIDGSDETLEACTMVNTNVHLYPQPSVLYPPAECHNGFLCRNGQCIEWKEVCDQVPNCFDGSDENGLCFSACENNTCGYSCHPTPSGPHCRCPMGLYDHGNQTCADVDECERDMCSQVCYNVPGSFLCSCHRGYALRTDRRSCKATKGNMAVVYVSGNSVRTISGDGSGAVLYSDPTVAAINDMDYHVRKNILYMTSEEAGKLIQLNGTQKEIVITNIGRPTKVAVDWVTGNVYFSDGSRIRVCNVEQKRCAKLQKLPLGSVVTALVVDPASARMFYCASHDEAVVWTATLSGRDPGSLAAVTQCTGLTLDSFKKRLFVADNPPAAIIQMDFDGANRKKLITADPHLQAPHGLAIFEDHIYFLVANSFKLSRCLLFGQKRCEPYIYRIFDANTFVLKHESIQRDDVRNMCDDVSCGGVCVLGDRPVCVCEDGAISKDGTCVTVPLNQLPLFDGWRHPAASQAAGQSHIFVGVTLVTLVLLAVVIVYKCHWRRRYRNLGSLSVRFQNKLDEEFSTPSTPTIEIPTSSVNRHEFVNPMELVRNIWNKSFRKRTKPVAPCGLSVEVGADLSHSQFQDNSDTESDIDVKETKPILR